ncbi:DEAD/DEAH box helicase [Wenzhouxiangella marina]|uniref:ATP-dependent RNA helicase DeaD n=1 Tax=Wenzhouxiangella marina TaxID=1579979 RepID=A0A0K0XVH4_9GAMM|nr:DEAD/DEAH box helicase [Wenzhouxiangella marina]AKS41621.1 ATP-dependent RNA helicase DeaD [Wenzhouxiangella marina]MBB6086620.1 ATP-dependent RNA helicase DeaD [Wenzhouxiangella marina]
MSDQHREGEQPSESPETASFAELGLPEVLLGVLTGLGYEAPSPIQAATIPALLNGSDVLGQAQTGTGKTAAFALPVLARLRASSPRPAALVLVPTRELAIQVAEAFQRYASGLDGFHVLPIYGGQAYGPQLAGLRRGADVVVGTPGRVIDHLDKGTLDLSHLSTLVLDEADEMLRMGFIDDVENVLSKMPKDCQIALFSATMPAAVARIAERYLKDPERVTIRSRTTTAATIRQRYWLVSGLHKLDALTRILEVEPFDAMIVFARTRVATEELAQRLNARGFSAAALNGDVPQQQREQFVERLKGGDIDILVATDVAARGLDVERISHVVNYDIPYDTEAYVHRIGRTGRAGRAGEAILFVAPRERGMLRAIERATRQPIEPMGVPSVADVNEQRVQRFKKAVAQALEEESLDVYREVVDACQQETGAEMSDIAAALARLLRGGDELLLSEPEPLPGRHERRPDRPPRERSRPNQPEAPSEEGLRSYRVEVGNVHGVRTGNLVGAIANEANLDSSRIGRIRIRDQFSLVELPADLPQATLDLLARVRVAGQALDIRVDTGPVGPPRRSGGPHRKEGKPHRGQRREGPVRESWRPDSERGERPPRGRAPKAHSSDRPAGKGKPTGKPGRKADAEGKGARKSDDSDGRRPPVRRAVQSRAARKAGHTARRVKPKKSS